MYIHIFFVSCRSWKTISFMDACLFVLLACGYGSTPSYTCGNVMCMELSHHIHFISYHLPSTMLRFSDLSQNSLLGTICHSGFSARFGILQNFRHILFLLRNPPRIYLLVSKSMKYFGKSGMILKSNFLRMPSLNDDMSQA